MEFSDILRVQVWARGGRGMEEELVFLWYSFGIPMEFVGILRVQGTSGISMDSIGIPKEYQRNTNGILWYSFGIPLVFVWHSFGIPLVFLWYSFGVPMEFVDILRVQVWARGERGMKEGCFRIPRFRMKFTPFPAWPHWDRFCPNVATRGTPGGHIGTESVPMWPRRKWSEFHPESWNSEASFLHSPFPPGPDLHPENVNEFHRNTKGIPKEYQRNTKGMPNENQRNAKRIPKDPVGIPLVFLWYSYGIH